MKYHDHFFASPLSVAVVISHECQRDPLLLSRTRTRTAVFIAVTARQTQRRLSDGHGFVVDTLAAFLYIACQGPTENGS